MPALTPARLGLHHVAHLRAVAQGVPVMEAAKRYLGIDHGHQAVTVHRAVLDLASAIARRRGDSRWRLLGITLAPAGAIEGAAPPSLEDWAQAQGLDDWSADELEALYLEQFGAAEPPGARRRQLRDERLRLRRLALLQDLELSAAQRPHATDSLAGWLAPALAQELLERGILTLGELQAVIAKGGRWWAGLRAYGPLKAKRLQAQIEQLLGPIKPPAWAVQLRNANPAALSGAQGTNRAPAGTAALEARDDRAAMRAWIAARAGSPLTAKAYEREAERFILWIVLERNKALSDAGAEDCRAYMDFLKDLPAAWVSRRHVPRLGPGWAPFSGQLSVGSQQQAIVIVNGLFQWLVDARYLAGNPWSLVRRRVGDDREAPAQIGETSRAFTPVVWAALFDQVDLEAATGGATAPRLRWLLTFAEATGLRASELLNVRRSDFVRRDSQEPWENQGQGWWLRVHGKGSRNRAVPVPTAAMVATIRYLKTRALDFFTADTDTPILASTTHLGGMAYQSLHASLKDFVGRALRTSALSDAQRRHAEQASSHWLRHTHATRAVEAGVPADVLQANLGQSDPRTTAGYYKTQLDRRAAEMERVYG